MSIDVSSGLPRSIRALTGLVLVLAVLASFGRSSAHPGRSCLAHQDCVACRWAADSVVVLPDPPPLPEPEWGATLAPADNEAAEQSSFLPASSRAPPRA